MTLIVAWLGVDTHGPSSAYIASDSRISWGELIYFDYARKVFAFNSYPDILGYCGDALFPSIVLSQIVELVDSGLLFNRHFSSEQKSVAIMERLYLSFEKYPNDVKSITANVFKVIHVSRDTSGKKFYCNLIKWKSSQGWTHNSIALPQESDLLFCIGSGSSEFMENYKRYRNGPNKATSRNIFHCFCDTLFNIKRKDCGGNPQLVGLYRKPNSNAIKFGTIIDGKRYFLGAEVDNLSDYNNIPWRNDLFELCDGYTMRRMGNAIPQPNILKKY